MKPGEHVRALDFEFHIVTSDSRDRSRDKSEVVERREALDIG